jgi:hypothetical protein
MDDISPGVEDSLYVFAEPSEVGREDGRSD